MATFPEQKGDDYALVHLEDTDKALPERINPATRYIHFKTIARGGKSIIQSCKDLHLGRVICFKKLRPEFEDDPIEQQRFLREARVTAMLQHPNTVPTYEVGRDSRGKYYFTMKLVHGYTLREVLDYRDRYDLRQLTDVLVQVANALQYAHTHHVVHRDIKPENILIGPFGEVLLLDWGLAKVWSVGGAPGADDDADTGDPVDPAIQEERASTITGQGKLQGTIAYMSPEQIHRDPRIDFRTDVYSLGVILYEVLAGALPFQGETVHDVTTAILETQPPKPSTIAKTPVPKLLEGLVMRCIATSPSSRPECDEMVRLLQENW